MSPASTQEIVSHGQCAPLVSFESDLLCEHHVTSGKITLGHKTPADARAFVKLVDIHTASLGYPVSPASVTADDLETARRFELVQLVRREPAFQELHAPFFALVILPQITRHAHVARHPTKKAFRKFCRALKHLEKITTGCGPGN